MPALSELAASPSHGLELSREAGNAESDSPPVGLQLGFARSSGADARAEPRQRRADPRKSRKEILELRQLDLQLALSCPRPRREDVQDELGAIDDPSREHPLEIAQLPGCELVVEHDEVRFGFLYGASQRLGLSSTEEQRRVGLGPLLNRPIHDRRPGSDHQAGQFVERALDGVAPARAEHQTDNRGTFGR